MFATDNKIWLIHNPLMFDNRKSFQLIQFVDLDKVVRIVPKKWLFLDEKSLSLRVHFMPPPYTLEATTMLEAMVASQSSSFADWPNYEVKILNEADTLEEAVAMLESLNAQRLIVTEDVIQRPICADDGNINIFDLEGRQIKRSLSSCGNDSGDYEQGERRLKRCFRNKKTDSSDGESSQETNDCPALLSQSEKTEGIVSIADEPDFDDPTSSRAQKKLKTDETTREILLDIRNSVEQMQANVLSLLNEQRDQIIQLTNIVQSGRFSGDNVTSTAWTDAYNLSFPLSNKYEFDCLEEVFQNNPESRHNFATNVDFVIDAKTNLSKNVLYVLRKFLSQELATQFTCKGNRQGTSKYVLKGTQFYDIIKETFTKRSVAGTLNEKEHMSERRYDEKLSKVLANAKDWKRAKQNKCSLQT